MARPSPAATWPTLRRGAIRFLGATLDGLALGTELGLIGAALTCALAR